MGISTNQILIALVVALIPLYFTFKLGRGLYKA